MIVHVTTVVLIMFVFTILMVFTYSRPNLSAWKHFADDHGFGWEFAGFWGNHAGQRFSVRRVVEGSGDSRRVRTKVNVRPPPGVIPVHLRMYAESFFSGVAKFFDAQDIQVGGPLDPAFMIQSPDSNATIRWANELPQEVVEELVLLRNRNSTLRIEKGSVSVSLSGTAEIKAILDEINRLSRLVCRMSETPWAPLGRYPIRKLDDPQSAAEPKEQELTEIQAIPKSMVEAHPSPRQPAVSAAQGEKVSENYDGTWW